VQVLAILFGAGFTIAVCLALGGLILREVVPDPGARFVTGAAALSVIVFGLCAVHLAYPLTFLLVGAVVVAHACSVQRRDSSRRASGLAQTRGTSTRMSMRHAASVRHLAFIPFFVLYFFYALAPEASPDGAGYHLGLVARYLGAHGFVRITDNFYAAFPGAVEMLFLHAFAFGQHSAAALVHLAFLIALTWQVSRFSWPAALLVFASPVVGIDAASAYNDVALAAIAFTLFHLLELWRESQSPRLLAAIGLLAGFAVATKLTAFLAIPWAILWVARKSRRGALAVAGLASLVFAPWFIKNWIWFQNPVAPFFNRIFPNPYVLPSFEDGYRSTMAIYHLTSRWQIPWDVTTRGTLSGLLGPIFLLSPIALLALRTSFGRRVLLAALVFGATYFTNIGTRFLIPMLPFVALAMASVPRLAIPIALIHALISWPALIPKYASPYSWHLTKIPWREALRLKPEGPYIESRLPYYAIDRLIEDRTAPGSTVFTFTAIPEAYTSRHIRVEFQSAENKITGLILWTASQPEYAPVQRIRWTFPRRPLRGVRVKAGSGPQMWSVHELRIFDGDRELPRAPEWRLRANPYPWGVQAAFDNSPVTMWLAGDTAWPGQFLQVDFGREEQVDSVVIESAPNQPQVGLVMDGPFGKASIFDVPRPLGLRRAAADEVKRRGNDYLLIFPNNAGADDYRLNYDLWGIRFLGEAAGARLYELPN
jgi:hypothetical protein